MYEEGLVAVNTADHNVYLGNLILLPPLKLRKILNISETIKRINTGKSISTNPQILDWRERI